MSVRREYGEHLRPGVGAEKEAIDPVITDELRGQASWELNHLLTLHTSIVNSTIIALRISQNKNNTFYLLTSSVHNMRDTP